MEIKKCPFCGGDPSVDRLFQYDPVDPSKIINIFYGISCSSCRAQSYRYCGSEEEAIMYWNQRTGE